MKKKKGGAILNAFKRQLLAIHSKGGKGHLF